MSDFVIVCDATCDLSKEWQERFNIKVVDSHIFIPGEPERMCGCSWDGVDQNEFYNALKKKGDHASSSPASIEEYKKTFIKYIKEGKDVLCISISSGLSGTHNFTLTARKEVMEQYPDAKIYCVDSLRYSLLFGLLAINASLLRTAGKSIEETVEWIENNKNRFHQMGWLDDLSFVASRGRISNSAAFFGTLVGIKPLGDIDYNGLTTVLGKARGKKAAYETILGYIEKTIENPEEQIIIIANSNREKYAEEFAELLKERIKPKDIIMTDVYPLSAINIGPGLMAAYYIGKPISEGLVYETAIMKELLVEN